MNTESGPSEIQTEHDNIPQRVTQTSFHRDHHGKNFDDAIFSEAFHDLEKEFDEADLESRRAILMRRFFDARASLSSEQESKFAQKYAIEIPDFSAGELRQLGIIDYGDIQNRILNAQARLDLAHAPSVHQYGPSLVIDVKAGEMATIENLGAEDILGTSLLTACSVLILMGENRLSLYHIRMSDPQVIDKLLSTESYTRAILIAPEMDTGREADETVNSKIENIETKYPELKTSRFPYWATDMRNNPHGIDSTSVLVGKDFVRQVGVKEKRKAGQKDDLYFEILDKCISDIQL